MAGGTCAAMVCESRLVRYLGIDLAWGEGSQARPASRSGVVALEPDGRIVNAGWTIRLAETIEWIEANSLEDTLVFVDAPVLIDNEHGQRLAERQVGQRYGKWWVSANSTNRRSPRRLECTSVGDSRDAGGVTTTGSTGRRGAGGF